MRTTSHHTEERLIVSNDKSRPKKKRKIDLIDINFGDVTITCREKPSYPDFAGIMGKVLFRKIRDKADGMYTLASIGYYFPPLAYQNQEESSNLNPRRGKTWHFDRFAIEDYAWRKILFIGMNQFQLKALGFEWEDLVEFFSHQHAVKHAPLILIYGQLLMQMGFSLYRVMTLILSDDAENNIKFLLDFSCDDNGIQALKDHDLIIDYLLRNDKEILKENRHYFLAQSTDSNKIFPCPYKNLNDLDIRDIKIAYKRELGGPDFKGMMGPISFREIRDKKEGMITLALIKYFRFDAYSDQKHQNTWHLNKFAVEDYAWRKIYFIGVNQFQLKALGLTWHDVIKLMSDKNAMQNAPLILIYGQSLIELGFSLQRIIDIILSHDAERMIKFLLKTYDESHVIELPGDESLDGIPDTENESLLCDSELEESDIEEENERVLPEIDNNDLGNQFLETVLSVESIDQSKMTILEKALYSNILRDLRSYADSSEIIPEEFELPEPLEETDNLARENTAANEGPLVEPDNELAFFYRKANVAASDEEISFRRPPVRPDWGFTSFKGPQEPGFAFFYRKPNKPDLPPPDEDISFTP